MINKITTFLFSFGLKPLKETNPVADPEEAQGLCLVSLTETKLFYIHGTDDDALIS